MRTSIRNFRVLGAAAAAAIAVAGAFGAGSSPTQEAKLTLPDPGANDLFGNSVAIDGDTALVGANGRSEVRVFTRTGTAWSPQAVLTGSDAVGDRSFGFKVAISGDTAVVGAMSHDSYKGAAYVFTRSGATWTEEAKLTSEDPVTQESQFGISVAISGDTLVVGAYGEGVYQGAAYVFTRTGTTWTREARLAADDGAQMDQFGFSVAVAGDTAVVGANSKASYQGAAYVFTRTGTVWTQQAELTSADAPEQAQFGVSVALAGDTALIGEESRNAGRGAVYVFTRSGTAWTRETTLTPSDSSTGDYFGNAVAISGDTAVAGAANKNSLQGAAYVFTRTGTSWKQQVKLAAAGGLSYDAFGASVAVAGDTALVGAYGANASSGAAYVFTDLTPRPEGFVLPTKATAKTNAKHPEKSTLTASGTFDTGGGPPDFSGAATLDVGGFHLDVPAFVAKRNTLTFSSGGVTLTITPAKNGSSRAVFSAKAVGDLVGKVDREGPLAFHFQNAAHDLNGAATLTKGALGPHCVTAPDLCLRSAAATIKGGGNDVLDLTLGFATDGVAPALGERDMTVGFGDAYTSPLLSGASFVRRRNTYVFTAKAPGITRVTVDYSKGTITIAASRLDLGAFAAGGNPVVVTITRGAETRSVAVRMSRAGAKLSY